MPSFVQPLRPFGSETLTVTNAVKTLTQTLYDNTAQITAARNLARKARGVVVENTSSNVIRYTEDGTTPVAATTGKLLNPGDVKFLESYASIVLFKMIREGASDAIVDVEYYR